MISGNINSITRLRIDADGSGVRSVIFMQGCPLRCFWCCNPETRTGSDFKTLDPDALYRYIEPDLPYFLASSGGVTFSGGEPLMQADFIHAFIEKHCGAFKADIETSLWAERDSVARLVPLIHTWNIDFKAADEAHHAEYTGVSNRLILENIAYLAKHVPPERIIFTVPIIPGCNDDEQSIAALIAFASENGLHQIELHPYRKLAEEKQRACGLPVTPVKPLSPQGFARIERQLIDGGMTIVRKKTYSGKAKCRYLKKLREKLCIEHGLPVQIAKCTFQGECIGTCPQCEHELSEIAQALAFKEKSAQ